MTTDATHGSEVDAQPVVERAAAGPRCTDWPGDQHDGYDNNWVRLGEEARRAVEQLPRVDLPDPPVMARVAGPEGETTWRSIGEVVAPIVKQLVVDAALGGEITYAAATKTVSTDWLRNA